jgi:uroporphyrinogen decarboxylase
MNNTKLLLTVLGKEKGSRVPFWFMRQAGRYLPEYKELRAKSKSFLDFCYTPAMASQATLQPIKRFGMDGAIIFSDILVIPDAMGMDVRFEEGKGPLLVPVQSLEVLDGLIANPDTLLPVYEALRITKAALPETTTLIGFAGAPWTLACYMVQGKADRDFQNVRTIARRNRAFFSILIARLVDEISAHAIRQVAAGAEVIQIFDSWAGVLSEDEFNEWVIAPTTQIVENIREACPGVPIIGFPRMAGTKYKKYALETKVDGLSVDYSVSLDWVAKELRGVCTVQGNLDPVLFAEDKNATLQQVAKILAAFGDNSFIFNLGHGILPHTPIENVEAVCDFIKGSGRA